MNLFKNYGEDMSKRGKKKGNEKISYFNYKQNTLEKEEWAFSGKIQFYKNETIIFEDIYYVFRDDIIKAIIDFLWKYKSCELYFQIENIYFNDSFSVENKYKKYYYEDTKKNNKVVFIETISDIKEAISRCIIKKDNITTKKFELFGNDENIVKDVIYERLFNEIYKRVENNNSG